MSEDKGNVVKSKWDDIGKFWEDLPPAKPKQPEGPKEPLVFQRGHELVVDLPPPREWIVDGLLPIQEVTLCTGERGAGKSTVAL